MPTPTDRFRSARDFLLSCREDYSRAIEGFRWPAMDEFNWAIDWFDTVAGQEPTASRAALWIVEEDGSAVQRSYAELSARSWQVANWLVGQGVRRGDRVVVMLGNQLELWETVLACMKLGAVVIPTSTLLGPDELGDRVDRGAVRHAVVRSEDAPKFASVLGVYSRIAVGPAVEGWTPYAEAAGAGSEPAPVGRTMADDPLLLYFTSGTTARPKLVAHTHASYPVGHLTTMYWIGLEPGDVHLNISSPGWAKHAWSNVFAPWIAEATVFVHNYDRFDAARLMAAMAGAGVTSFCAPPTVWRMLIQSDLSQLAHPPTKVVAAGEPLNPEVIEQVRTSWGVTVRDGFGQTETTLQVGNSPGQPVKPGSMGRSMPGYRIVLLDPVTRVLGREGEICIDLAERPLGLMTGYQGDDGANQHAMAGGYYHTGDVGSLDDDGYITYVGRADDVFKASDYRISPFEIESVLLEHPAVAEAAVVPSPDPIRLAVPKAYVVLAAGHRADRETAFAILRHARENLAPFKRVRRLEFAELPKTISGKIRRVELRQREQALRPPSGGPPPPEEFSTDDFPELFG